jgi:hypothetical protein
VASNVEQIRTAIRGRVWKSIAQSGVNLSSIPQPDQDALVDRITDDVLVEMDALMGSAQPLPEVLGAAPSAAGEEDERVLWQGRPFLSLVEYYAITSERVRIVSGLFGKDHENIELVRVKDLDWDQGLVERALGIGDIVLHSVDATRPAAVLRNVSRPAQVFEILRRAMLAARKKHHIIYEQEM